MLLFQAEVAFGQGNFWRQTNGLSEQIVVSLGSTSNGYIFAGTFHGVYLSTDRATTWYQKGLSFTSVQGVAVNRTDNVFLGTSNEVMS